ncbi:MAG: hypothetical protein JSU82_01905 [Rhodospirillales bacterium]|nr:MAG: hypothetical protein JSU82_01905 [Rhodospirillales bacterium]
MNRSWCVIAMRCVPLIVVLFVAGPTASALAEPAGAPIDHALFDANHCLTEIRASVEESAVEFHWGCPETELITISCVFDRTGYLGLGPDFARPGWHCNHPLPVLEDEDGRRISDIAVGDPHGRSVWAACAVAELGDFAARAKPYHGTACYRAMIAIKTAVNRDGRDPAAVAADILP